MFLLLKITKRDAYRALLVGTPEKNKETGVILHPSESPHKGRLCLHRFLPCPQGDRYGEVPR